MNVWATTSTPRSNDARLAELRARLEAVERESKRPPSGGPPSPPPEDWRARGVFKKDGYSWVGCLANAILILENDATFKGRICYDAFSEQIVAYKLPWRAEYRAWNDEDTSKLRAWLHFYENKYGIDVARGDVDAAVSVVAHDHSFHPLRDWLSRLVWDGVARLDRLFVDYFGAADTEYVRGVGSRWAISAVARAFDPGCQVDYAPVLEGPQGLGKSTGLGLLVGPEWFFNSGLDLSNLKAAYEAIQGKWVVELGELDALSKTDVTRVKAFLTSQNDHYRAAYARHAATRPRQVVFVGTTNEDRYLKDATGNRRFWPVTCVVIDRDAIRRDRDQLWAEAVHRWNAGEEWRPDGHLSRLAASEQEKRFQADAWEQPVAAWLGIRDGVTTYEVLTQALGIDRGRITRTEEIRCGGVLRRLGLVDVRRPVEGGIRVRRYFRSPTTPDIGHDIGHQNHSQNPVDVQSVQSVQTQRDKVEEDNTKSMSYTGVPDRIGQIGQNGQPEGAGDATSGVRPTVPEDGVAPTFDDWWSRQ